MKLYADPSDKTSESPHTVMLYPFWGKNLEDPNAPESGRYDAYEQMGKQFFQLTSLEQAQLAVAPAGWESSGDNRRLTRQLVNKASVAGKKTAVFFWSDSTEDIPLDNTLILRTSFYRSTRKTNEFAMPSWSEDFVEKHLGGNVPIRPKTERPIVGFCGYALMPGANRSASQVVRRWAKSILKPGSPDLKHGASLRGRVLHNLSTHGGIQTNFIVREQFLGGAFLPDGQVDPEKMRQIRAEFVQNMVESQYIVCARGGGNFSYRLYETLSCGRIPVFIDTDCVLPYDFMLDWKQYCVWVDQNDADSVAQKVLDFHGRLTPQAFEDFQRACREFWLQWLSPSGFFQHFHHHLEVT